MLGELPEQSETGIEIAPSDQFSEITIEPQSSGDGEQLQLTNESLAYLGFIAIESAKYTSILPNPEAAAEFKDRLGEYKISIDNAVMAYSEQLLAQSETKYGPDSVEVMQAFCEVLSRGGKRSRGALAMVAYDMFGGEDQEVATQLAVALEIFHAYLLVTDDICDRSLRRRDGPTAHKIIEAAHREHELLGDPAHYGVAQALIASLIAQHEAQNIVLGLDLPDAIKVRLASDLNETLSMTGHGQSHDIANGARATVTESQVLRTFQLKTAHYSFFNPLKVGAIAAGARVEELDVLQRYADEFGIGYQIIDDLLGMYGREADTGKPITDDTKEGKRTIHVVHALSMATAEQQAHILAALGNPELTVEQFEVCRQTIEATGSREYAQQLARQHTASAIVALEGAPEKWKRRDVSFLRELARYYAKRVA